MTDYTPSTYGDRIAGRYDHWFGDIDVEAVVERLAELAGTGPALELGMGTGRVALPLIARGVTVHGIDASAEMVAAMRLKPGGSSIPVHLGDFAEVGVEGRFRLVYVVFNTFFALLTQESQLRCFANVAARLAPAGVFVIEAFVPDPGRFDRDQRTAVQRIEGDQVVLEVAVHDRALQTVDARFVVLSRAGVEQYPLKIRYAWPSELDLMARLAGLRLVHRWAGWRREPFTSASTVHVSVYERVRS